MEMMQIQLTLKIHSQIFLQPYWLVLPTTQGMDPLKLGWLENFEAAYFLGAELLQNFRMGGGGGGGVEGLSFIGDLHILQGTWYFLILVFMQLSISLVC